jgi:hypothetical protein
MQALLIERRTYGLLSKNEEEGVHGRAHRGASSIEL